MALDYGLVETEGVMEVNHAPDRVVIAPAGRRIDAPDTDPPRLPLENVPMVRQRLVDMFTAERVEALVCSAACGADLIALEEAERLGIRRRIVLPFSPDRFRDTSVTDRPGDWGPIFDRIIAAAKFAGDLVILDDLEVDNDAAYAAANEAIVHEAQGLIQSASTGAPYRGVVAIVWEGGAREGIDASGGLRDLARRVGFEERSVLTR
jgi:hypothetical protein